MELLERLSPTKKKITGFSSIFLFLISHRSLYHQGHLRLAVFAGMCYGSNFTPPQWVMDNVAGAPQNGLDYVFSHFCTSSTL